MHPSKLECIDWPLHLGVDVVYPLGTHTTFRGTTSLIDYFLISKDLRHIVTDITLVDNTPWRHYAYTLTLTGGLGNKGQLHE